MKPDPSTEGVALLPAPEDVRFVLGGPAADTAGQETADVSGQSFVRALRVRTKQAARHSDDVWLEALTVAPVEKNDVLLATFWARCAESRAETAEATAHFIFEAVAPPHERSWGNIWSTGSPSMLGVGPAWAKIELPFVAAGSYAPGEARVRFDVGFAPQVLEIADLRVTNLGRTVDINTLPRTDRSHYAGREPNAPWREAAHARIEQIRKADLWVSVVDLWGAPVPQAQVRVQMRRHAFGWGSAVKGWLLMQDTPEAGWYRDQILRLFNKVVFENEMKWTRWETPNGREATLRGLDWLESHGIDVRGHVLVWPSWPMTPPRLRQLAHDPDALRAEVRDHIRDEAGALRGRLGEWDVVNEPYTHHDLLDVLGDAVMADWFREARQADPNARLFINDFGILSGGGADTAHQAHYENTIRDLVRRGAPFDGIGFQGHFGAVLTSPDKLLHLLDRYAVFGKSLQITEFDVTTDDEALQADYTRDLMTTVFSHPSFDGFVMWGFWEKAHWRPQAAMLRTDGSLKPNGHAYLDLVRGQWWTDVEGRTDAQGAFQTRGFLGDYEVAATHEGETKSTILTLPKEGTRAEIVLDKRSSRPAP